MDDENAKIEVHKEANDAWFGVVKGRAGTTPELQALKARLTSNTIHKNAIASVEQDQHTDEITITEKDKDTDKQSEDEKSPEEETQSEPFIANWWKTTCCPLFFGMPMETATVCTEFKFNCMSGICITKAKIPKTEVVKSAVQIVEYDIQVQLYILDMDPTKSQNIYFGVRGTKGPSMGPMYEQHMLSINLSYWHALSQLAAVASHGCVVVPHGWSVNRIALSDARGIIQLDKERRAFRHPLHGFSDRVRDLTLCVEEHIKGNPEIPPPSETDSIGKRLTELQEMYRAYIAKTNSPVTSVRTRKRLAFFLMYDDYLNRIEDLPQIVVDAGARLLDEDDQYCVNVIRDNDTVRNAIPWTRRGSVGRHFEHRLFGQLCAQSFGDVPVDTTGIHAVLWDGRRRSFETCRFNQRRPAVHYHKILTESGLNIKALVTMSPRDKELFDICIAKKDQDLASIVAGCFQWEVKSAGSVQTWYYPEDIRATQIQSI